MSLQDKVERIQAIIDAGKNDPDGTILINTYYHANKLVADALLDIKARSAIGGNTKADQILMDILSEAYPLIR